MQTIAFMFLASFVLLYVVQLCLDFRRSLKAIRNFPGNRQLLDSASLIANVITRPIPGITKGRGSQARRKHADFEYYGCDVYSSVCIWPKSRFDFIIADAAAIKEITTMRARWPKPTEQYGPLKTFGSNIIVTEGDEWKKHRKVANPAFSERNNKLVWEETTRIMHDMFDNVWQHKDEVVVDHCEDLTKSLALFVIGSAGFGRRISWEEEQTLPPGHQISFKEALRIISMDMLIKGLLPSWAFRLTKRLRTIRLAYDELQVYIREMIKEQLASNEKVERNDLFTNLLEASEEEVDGEAKLSESELMGNIFIFLLAGHETTAHALAFTFGLLAIHQDEQEILFQHIKSVLPDGRDPTYEDVNLLTQSMAVFCETLRMFPPVGAVPKSSAEDTTLVVSNAAGENVIVPVPKGAGIVMHIPGLHYNPRYWKDPFEFKPQRFNEDWPRDAFLPFSDGARSCVGRRFAEIEAVVIITMLVARYRIEVKEEPQFAAETLEERKARVLAHKPGLTMTPVRVPLVFKKR